jgi:hypothetical protein
VDRWHALHDAEREKPGNAGRCAARPTLITIVWGWASTKGLLLKLDEEENDVRLFLLMSHLSHNDTRQSSGAGRYRRRRCGASSGV